MVTRTRKISDVVEQIDAAPAQLFDEHSLPVRALGVVSDVGDQPQLRLLSGSILLGGLALGNSRLARAGLRMLLAHELATLVKNVVKTSVDRKRPRSSKSKEERKIRPGTHTSKEMTSFPSGHTAGSAAVARAFARDFPDQAPLAYGTAGAVALAQIPRCAHYPTDIGAGLLIGLATEAIAAQILPAVEDDAPSGFGSQEADPRPPGR